MTELFSATIRAASDKWGTLNGPTSLLTIGQVGLLPIRHEYAGSIAAVAGRWGAPNGVTAGFTIAEAGFVPIGGLELL